MNDWMNIVLNNAESIINAGSVNELSAMLVDMGVELNEEENRILSGRGLVALEDDALEQIAGGTINLEKASVGLRFLLELVGREGENSELLQKLQRMGQSAGSEISQRIRQQTER